MSGNNALILGCGNIAQLHVKALKQTKHNIYAFDYDTLKQNIFCEKCSVFPYTDEIKQFNIIVLCVPYDYRSDYFNDFIEHMDDSGFIVIEKPLTNIIGVTHNYVNKNIQKIWTPYIRAINLPKINNVETIDVYESRGYLHSSNSLRETIFDLLPHWLSIFGKYNILPEKYQITKKDNKFRIEASNYTPDNRDLKSTINFNIGDTKFKLMINDKQVSFPKNKISIKEFLSYPKYYYYYAKGGAFFQFYALMLDNNNELRSICDNTFSLSSRIKIDET